MFFVKDLARSILHEEITDMEDELKCEKRRYEESRAETEKLQEKIKELGCRNEMLINESDKIELEKVNIQMELDEVQKENEILRKYYDLDSEPSDEIKAKIHIDLELNRLKEENLKLIAMYKPPTIISQPYPMYTPQFGRTFY